MMIVMMIMILLLLIFSTLGIEDDVLKIITSSHTILSSAPYLVHKTCLSNDNYEGSLKCTKPKSCARYIEDGFVSLDDVEILNRIAQKGLDFRNHQNNNEETAGPTILDINTGYIRDSVGLSNVFNNDVAIYNEIDFANYFRIILSLKRKVENVFGIEDVFFTAPTFITNIIGSDSWEPKQIHDEYWHLHCDNNNTAHYHYSGLLYLSSYNEDFTGGRLKFFNEDEKTEEKIIEPKRGRVMIFSSGRENPHSFERVISGTRRVLAFWFTCDKNKQFEIFLDGKAHNAFSERIKKGLKGREL